MNATDVRACLCRRWPDSEYLCIEEAPEDSSRAGRKIDLLIISLWRSRGLERDAVEVKVSLSDWNRERDNGGKADFWWRHSHRFWLAAPAALAIKIRDDLPATWGLLACEPDTPPKAIVKATRREPEPLSWQATIGVMRAAANAGLGALSRAEQRGFTRGLERGRDEQAKLGPGGAFKVQYEELRYAVDEFEAASGITIGARWNAGPIGEAVNLILAAHRNPNFTLENVARAADGLLGAIRRLSEAADSAKALAQTIAEHSVPPRVTVPPASLFSSAGGEP